MKFKALIDGVHFDPKKGAVRIVLVGASHVSLDELTTLSPKDETIQVTFESEQTKLEEREPEKLPYLKEADPDDVPDDEGEEGDSKHWLQYKPDGKEQTHPDEESEESSTVTEFPTEEAEKEVKDVGDSITLKGEDAVVKLKEAAERLKEGDEDEVEGGGQEV